MTFGSFQNGGLEAFYANADVIEQMLGEMMGLDLAREFFGYEGHLGYVGMDVTWEVPSQFHPFTIVVAYNDQEGRTTDEITSYVLGRFADCWQNGKSWATGIADQIKRYGEGYGSVDVSERAAVADDLEQRVAMGLSGLLTSNFSTDAQRGTDLEKTLGNFQGEFAGKLHGFYTNVGDFVNSWATYASSVAAGYAGAAAVINACQHDLAEWGDRVRAHCDSELALWAETGGFGILAMQKSTSGVSTETLAKFTEIVSFGASVVALFPPAAPVAGTVGSVSGIVGTVLGAVDSAPERPVSLTGHSALEVWGWEDSGSGASHELGSKIVDGCSDALRDLRTKQKDGDPSGTSDVAAEAERRRGSHEWFAPRPSGVADPKPGDLFYDV